VPRWDVIRSGVTRRRPDALLLDHSPRGAGVGRLRGDHPQQPKESNGYTAIFKVRDPMSGLGHYDFDVTWN
jgi:hypothetical protein